MSTVNKVILVANLGADPEIRNLGESGERVANLRCATSERWKDRATGEQKEKTEWHSVSVFGEGLVGTIEKYAKKGQKVYIEGQLQTREYEKEGQTHRSTDVVIRGFGGTFRMLDQGGGNGGGQNEGNSGNAGGNQGGGVSRQNNTPDDNFDDEVPF